jgi:excisionase family DNA binding protein
MTAQMAPSKSPRDGRRSAQLEGGLGTELPRHRRGRVTIHRHKEVVVQIAQDAPGQTRLLDVQATGHAAQVPNPPAGPSKDARRGLRSVPTDANEAKRTPNGARRLDVPLLRPEQAAELLAVKTSWVYDAVRGGRLPCLRVGKHIRFTRAMLEEWLQSR